MKEPLYGVWWKWTKKYPARVGTGCLIWKNTTIIHNLVLASSEACQFYISYTFYYDSDTVGENLILFGKGQDTIGHCHLRGVISLPCGLVTSSFKNCDAYDSVCTLLNPTLLYNGGYSLAGKGMTTSFWPQEGYQIVANLTSYHFMVCDCPTVPKNR